jgi:hypothetical protein
MGGATAPGTRDAAVETVGEDAMGVAAGGTTER